MTEKEIFLKTWEREYGANLEVLNALPNNKLTMKPSDQSETAGDLAWSIVAEERDVIGGGVTGEFDIHLEENPPTSIEEIIKRYKSIHNDTINKVQSMSELDFNKSIKGFSSPRLRGDIRCADVMWGGLFDTIQNRGQLSVYMNIAGAKVPETNYVKHTY